MNTTSTTYNRSTIHFTIDFVNKNIVGTKASVAKAGKGFGAEYNELTAKMAAHPDFTPVIKAQKPAKSKRTYDGMDFAFMENYIATLDNAVEMQAEYAAVKKMAKDCGTKTYPLAKKWFLEKFGTKEVPFNMEQANKRIRDYRILSATDNSSKSNENTSDKAC